MQQPPDSRYQPLNGDPQFWSAASAGSPPQKSGLTRNVGLAIGIGCFGMLALFAAFIGRSAAFE
jgi:hypothetical protein